VIFDRLQAPLAARGASPYSIFELAGRTNRMGYLPGTLFMNWPAWAVGLDLRWNTVLYRIAWMLLIGAHLRRTRSLNSPAGLAFVWLFLSPYINFRHELYFEGFILGLVVLVLYPNWSVLLAPALIVSRQWAWVMAPFWAITITFGSGRLSFRKPLQASVASIAVVAGLVTLLYSSTSFEELWRAIFWFQGAVHSPAYSGDYGLTFSPIFYWLGIAEWQQRVQASITLVFVILALRDRDRPHQVFRWSVLAWVLFLQLNGHYWLYFWNSLLVYLATLEMKVAMTNTLTEYGALDGHTRKQWENDGSNAPREAETEKREK
jgi:hypothetical protein